MCFVYKHTLFTNHHNNIAVCDAYDDDYINPGSKMLSLPIFCEHLQFSIQNFS